jgi:hypothetical protein
VLESAKLVGSSSLLADSSGVEDSCFPGRPALAGLSAHSSDVVSGRVTCALGACRAF